MSVQPQSSREIWLEQKYAFEPPAPLAADELDRLFALTCRFGSGNCWTGTTGELACGIRTLLGEIDRLEKLAAGPQP